MTANLLKPSDYTDTSIFNLEQKRIFSKGWHYAGLQEDVAEIDHYITVTQGYCSYVIAMGEDGLLHAFQNVCRHRGMPLLEGKGKLPKQLTCPYHDWTYNKQGILKSLPKKRHEFPTIDKACLSLKKAKVAIWRGMIWLNSDIDAVDIAHYFKEVEPLLAPYDVTSLIEVKEEKYETIIAANWKLVVENYIDHYHLAQLHSGTLAMYDHKKAQFGFVGDHFHFWEPLSKDYQVDIEKNSPLPLLLDKKDPKLGAYVPMLFPCTGLAESESSWSVFQIIPLAVDRTKVIVRTKVKDVSMLSFIKQSLSSYNYWQNKVSSKRKRESSDKNHALTSADFMQEDAYVCEQVQQSLNNPFFEFGPSALMGEAPIRQFQQIVKRRLSGF